MPILVGATLNACTPAEAVKGTPASARVAREQANAHAKICNIIGGPLVQCCPVSKEDKKMLEIVEAGGSVCLHTKAQVEYVFTCPSGSRLTMDNQPKGRLPEGPVDSHAGYGRWACLEDKFETVADKRGAANCVWNMEPVVYCNPDEGRNGTRVVQWMCYGTKYGSGPYEN